MINKSKKQLGRHVAATLAIGCTIAAPSALAAEDNFVITATNKVYGVAENPRPDQLKEVYAEACGALTRLIKNDKGYLSHIKNANQKAADQHRAEVLAMKESETSFTDNFLGPEDHALTEAGVSQPVRRQIIAAATQFKKEIAQPVTGQKMEAGFGLPAAGQEIDDYVSRLQSYACDAKPEMVRDYEQSEALHNLKIGMAGAVTLIVDAALVETLAPVSNASMAIGLEMVKDAVENYLKK